MVSSLQQYMQHLNERGSHTALEDSCRRLSKQIPTGTKTQQFLLSLTEDKLESFKGLMDYFLTDLQDTRLVTPLCSAFCSKQFDVDHRLWLFRAFLESVNRSDAAMKLVLQRIPMAAMISENQHDAIKLLHQSLGTQICPGSEPPLALAARTRKDNSALALLQCGEDPDSPVRIGEDNPMTAQEFIRANRERFPRSVAWLTEYTIRKGSQHERGRRDTEDDGSQQSTQRNSILSL